MMQESRSDESTRAAQEAQAAEASFLDQIEDHPLPATQVLGEQRDGCAGGQPSCVFVP